jgi:AcrR family transcriptional regulator
VRTVEQEAAGRSRNPRGQGGRLREEILQAGADLLDEHGTEQAITLRAVARRIGIAAPSIYAHFPDREAIVGAVVQDAFRALREHLDDAQASAPDPVARLRAICAAYLRFAAESPQRYGVMFGSTWTSAREQGPAGEGVRIGVGPCDGAVDDGAFDVLVSVLTDCVEDGASRSTDPFTDATALWVALHGLAQLRSAATSFPWPPGVLDVLVDRLARLR